MGTGYSEADGYSGDRAVAFNERIAKGGAALVTLGVVGVGWPLGNVIPNQSALSEDRFIPGIRKIADAVHAQGAKFALQLHFAGIVANPTARQPAWCPSIPKVSIVPGSGNVVDQFYLPDEVEEAGFADLPPIHYHEMTKADIKHLIELFANAAYRAKEANVDGLEIHGGHGYILSSFISPHSNRRTDEYGGSLENRTRLLAETLKAVRQSAGPEMAVWPKIDAIEYGRKDGITLDDAIATAKIVEEAGADAITVTAYHDPSIGSLHSGSHTPDIPSLNVDKAAAIKEAVKIPITLSGRIEPEAGEKIISTGGGDFIAMGRKLLADPDLPVKLAAGKPEEIRPCIYCYTCISAIYTRGTVRCAVNAETGFEQDKWLEPSPIVKKIVIIGGGPAGMEAAHRLSERGHKVTLIERGNRLGGTLLFASIAYEPNERILNWLRLQVQHSKVEVKLKTTATVELLKRLAPDEIIVASGAVRDLPDIQGNDQPHVLSGDDMRQLILGEDIASLKGKVGFTTRLAAKAGASTGLSKAPGLIREATKTWLPLAKRIVIIGGDLVGLELAEFLAHRDRKVAVIDEVSPFGRGLQIVRRWRVIEELDSLDVDLHQGCKEISITPDEVTALNAEGKAVRLPADQVIVAKGARGELALAADLEDAGFSVHSIGDCTGVGYIEGPIRSAADLARTL
jgi:2,4-dienoyl-CoA reductase-like NADH-dependent reductase (Old Yellow Enzyme family)/thioredoxin reductase